ncbi:hypothetical protein [Anaerosalibacter sp. Marseille-P3206]|uniref:hypothetical protein n=1 Tax=Anaerosalibacter sp. Marseille-P3206 TaxID=1871005 RepID=UPI00098504E4|nr:hypothetical protein [Anaerosalibacter sp. Marseille-P3206]
MGIKILDIITKLSFVFSILTYLMPYNNLVNYAVIYVTSIGVTCLGYYLKEKSKNYYMIGLLMIPLYFLIKGEGNTIFLTLAIFFTYFFVVRYNGISTHGLYIDNFVKGFGVYIFIIVFSLITRTSGFINNLSGLFMIMYFISSVILIRSMRHIENNQSIEKINRQNIIYSIFILVFSILLTMEKFVNFIGNGIKLAYNFLVDLFLKLFYWVFIGAGYIAMYLTEFLKKLSSGEKIEPPEASENSQDIMEILKHKKSGGLPPIVATIINWAIKILIIVFIIYIINKIFKRNMSRKHVKEEYVEESEFINVKEIKEKKKRSIFRPKGEKAQIRYYYEKFLRKCIKDDIPIVEQDTTKDINRKATNKYEFEALDNLRNIYIRVRYGNKDIDKMSVKEYKKNYKKIK